MKYICMFVVGICFCMACQEEDTIIPRDVTLGSRYEFPQGENEWDKTAQKIRDKFGVMMIYKDFDTLDLRRSWLGEANRLYKGECLTDERVAFHMKFMDEHIFAYLTPEITKKVFPMYYYMVYDLNYFQYSVQLVCSMDDGLDFWATSICNQKEPALTTWELYRNRRLRHFRSILQKAFNQGNIVAPKNFHAVFNYETEVSIKKEESNYYLRRGFPGLATTMDAISFGSVTKISILSPDMNFVAYLNVAMRYRKGAELEAAYPIETCPLIHKMRDEVVSYMKEKYNVDLEAIAEGPEL